MVFSPTVSGTATGNRYDTRGFCLTYLCDQQTPLLTGELLVLGTREHVSLYTLSHKMCIHIRATLAYRWHVNMDYMYSWCARREFLMGREMKLPLHADLACRPLIDVYGRCC